MKVNFFKLQASGNDFILIDQRADKKNKKFYTRFAKKHCQRKTAIGADGLLVVEHSNKFDFKMRIFNPDGSEAEMCGNGARCIALWAFTFGRFRKKLITFKTKAGTLRAKKIGTHKRSPAGYLYQNIKIKMTDPVNIRLDLPLVVSGRKIIGQYMNTGVPHLVLPVENIDQLDICKIGSAIRYHQAFKPEGTNVDFVQTLRDCLIKIRTYERGVEGETLACGTGTVASALTWLLKKGLLKDKGTQQVKVEVGAGDILQVDCSYHDNHIHDVWLQGKTYFIYKGIL
jgi:diaminopimelate epimerase